ncbi:SDR family oxidoreductase [Actinomycetes bacterium KLBMP 9797]
MPEEEHALAGEHPRAARRTVLLTGATGVVGRALVAELAADHEIICLRRRRALDDPRVTELDGDLAREDLGLGAARRAALAGRLDLIVHAAAATSWRASRQNVFATNVDGTGRMLALAAELGVPLYYVSTAFVARPPRERDGETFTGPAAYLASKIEAEQRVRTSGVPAVIVRPSVVIGNSQDGWISAFQGLHRAAGAVVRGDAPLVPADLASIIDLMPQDIVARAIGALVRGRVTTGEYWLTAGEGAPLVAEMIDVAVALGQRLGIYPHRPRLIPIEAVDRLLVPLLAETGSALLRRRFRDFIEMMLLFQSGAALPSSMAQLGLGAQVTRPALMAAFTRSMEFWARRTGLAPAGSDEPDEAPHARPAVVA